MIIYYCRVAPPGKSIKCGSYFLTRVYQSLFKETPALSKRPPPSESVWFVPGTIDPTDDLA